MSKIQPEEGTLSLSIKNIPILKSQNCTRVFPRIDWKKNKKTKKQKKKDISKIRLWTLNKTSLKRDDFPPTKIRKEGI